MTNILVCAGASVAVYKTCDLASKLTQAGHRVRVILTVRAAELIAPQLFEALTGEPAATSEFGAERRGAMDHIELARWAELALVAPCTADLAARLAHGFADDLATTALLALDERVPRVLCPAMNPKMLGHPAVQRNFGILREDGWRVLEPASGHMACGEEGAGRLVEPSEILRLLQDLLS